MTTLIAGARLGAFEVLQKLGEGGMGAVYRARDTRLHRDVAIKVLLPAIAGDPDRLARFEREAQVLASLNHPNIAAIYGIESAGDATALVLELVDGPTLADRIASGPVLLEDALAIAAQIADALAAAHDQGIVHRDLKPANIKLRADGTVKVLDFGLAKAMDAAAVSRVASAATLATMSAHATSAGVILGTAAYMSPEQASGKPVDKRTDIWAFGVVLWEMLTGRRLFDGETTSHVLAAVLTQEPDLSSVPPRVSRLLGRCLERDPKRRLRDVGDAMTLVDGAATVRHDRLAPRWPLVASWIIAGLLAVALGAALWSRPPVADAGDGPAVRFPIARSSVDPYNNSVTAFSLSPDGRYLAYYTATSDGRATLSVQTLATGERREVPGSVALSPMPPFWSHDSRHLAFGTSRAASVLDMITGTTRDLCGCRFRGGSWNRDGVILLGAAPNAGAGPIRRLTLQDPVPVPVTILDDPAGDIDSMPVFLPDGERFLFTREKAGAGRVTYLAALGGGAPRRIADGSRRLAAGLPGGPSYLLGLDAAGLTAHAVALATLETIGEPVLVVPGAAAVAVSDNGVLATSAPAGRPVTQPAWLDRAGTTVGTVGAPGAITNVALAPGGRLAAVGEWGQDGTNIWLRDGAGGNRRLTPGGGDAAVWSPDGTSLVVSKRQGASVALFKRATDGSGREEVVLSTGRNAYGNDWSRDGRWLIFTMPTMNAGLDLDLWTVPAAGAGNRTPVPYLTTTARESQAKFSPDGNFVAYTSMTTGDPEVYVQPFPDPSGGKWLVSSGGGAEPHWSRDGKELFYIAGQTVMAVPVTLRPAFSAGTPRRLFEAAVQPWYINDSDRFQVAPDGLRFLMLVAAGTAAPPPIDVVVNWTALLRK